MPVLIFFTSRHYYFFEKLKIVEKQLCKLNWSYGKVSHTLKKTFFSYFSLFFNFFFFTFFNKFSECAAHVLLQTQLA